VLQTPHRQPLLRHRSWYVWQTLNQPVMQMASDLLIGEHDFAAFGQPPNGENTIRRVFLSQWERESDTLVYRIEATAFLQHMVRRIVAMLVEVGRENLTLEAFEAIFRSADLAQVKHMAPPQGLVLTQVRYPT
jgi:tRNA pseudouridine38-40 synthase